MKQRTFITLLIALALLALGGAWIYRSRQQAAQAAQVDTGRQVAVRRGTLVSTVRASGAIEPEAQVRLNFGMVGIVAEIEVKEGQLVREGEVLARLDTAELELAVAQAEKAYQISQLAYKQTAAGAKLEEVAAAEAQLASAEAQYAELVAGAKADQVAAAEAQMAQARAQLKLADETHERTMQCFDVKLPTGEKKQICPALGTFEEQSRSQLEATQAAYTAAEASYNRLLSGASTAQRGAAQAQIQQAQANLARLRPDENRIALAQVQMKQAQLALEQAKQQLEKAVLVAPFDGVVAELNLTRGQIVATTGVQAAVVLVDLSRYHITLSVDEIDVGYLQAGQAVAVTADALPGVSIAGQVERIAPVATVAGTVVAYQVTVRLEPSAAPLRAGMSANVSIVTEERPNVLIVPNWAIRLDRATGKAYVNLKQGDQLREVEIVAGLRNESDSEVISGLAEGDVVA
ncbi:MAG: efflux RND transporter periplasmic adaptor subunit, partial [Thermoflexales bacterium]|nr:efflux RND transporter periplasmic adaptor subunit [Thermoflexales bacterium]